LVDDAAWFVESLSAEHGSLPTFLYGESMGGALALCASEKLNSRGHPLAGLILSAPMCLIGGATLPHPVLIALGSLLAWIVPTVPAPFLRDLTDKIFRHVERRAEALRNPFRLAGPPRIGTAMALKSGSEAAARAAANASCSLLLLHGTDDVVTPPAASHTIFTTSRSRDKALVEFDGAWHALWAEPVDTRRRLLASFIAFIAGRVDGVAHPMPSICPDGADHVALLSPSAVADALRESKHGVYLRKPAGVEAWRDDTEFTAARDPTL
jgi:alpha-beta hydrolase superfamily lysophospholipase